MLSYFSIHRLKTSFWVLLVSFFSFSACKESKKDNSTDKTTTDTNKTTIPKTTLVTPDFNPDSAYFYIAKQVSFGPRMPQSKGHTACGAYLYETLKTLGMEVEVQSFEAESYDKIKYQGQNIIASLNPKAEKRILLAAHWDTRRYADKEKDKNAQNKPIDGANDGASGVGVILEILRTIQKAPQKPNIGVDIIFFDLEDDGTPENNTKYQDTEGKFWCLGSKYWSKNKHKPNYSAYFGILLDMVGGKNAKFYKEPFSIEYANETVEKIWAAAQKLNFGHIFINQKAKMQSGGMEDDHLYVNRDAKIPMVDIIDHDTEFGSYHHTQADNLQVIDKQVLKAVGQTVLQVIYAE
jgi:glutaminyl-peptide cyclotransferase